MNYEQLIETVAHQMAKKTSKWWDTWDQTPENVKEMFRQQAEVAVALVVEVLKSSSGSTTFTNEFRSNIIDSPIALKVYVETFIDMVLRHSPLIPPPPSGT